MRIRGHFGHFKHPPGQLVAVAFQLLGLPELFESHPAAVVGRTNAEGWCNSGHERLSFSAGGFPSLSEFLIPAAIRLTVALGIEHLQIAEIGQFGIDRIAEPPGLEGDDSTADRATEAQPLVAMIEKELAIKQAVIVILPGPSCSKTRGDSLV